MIHSKLPILVLLTLCFAAIPCFASLSVTLAQAEEKCFIFRTPGSIGEMSHITGSYDMLDDDLSSTPVTSTLFDDDYAVLWHSDPGASEGSFITRGSGRYHLCFGNGSGAYKTKEDHEKERLKVEGHHIDDDNFDYGNHDGKDRNIAFNIRVTKRMDPSAHKSQTAHSSVFTDRVVMMATRLEDKIDLLMDHQYYIKNRELQHRDTVEETFTLVMKWTVLEAVVLIFVATSQVIYFRKFFETKRYL